MTDLHRQIQGEVNQNRFHFRALVLLAAVIATSWAVSLPRTSNAEVDDPMRSATIVTLLDGKNPNGGKPLLGGGSATPFSFELPVGAACPGDSAEGGYRIQGYLVSESYSPVRLQFGSNGPLPVEVGSKVLQPLFSAETTASYSNAQTAKADIPKGPGLVVSLPAFNFAVFSKGHLTPGIYNVGIACTLGPASSTQVKRVWNAQITMETDDSDPVGIRWVAMSEAGPGQGSSSSIASPDSVLPSTKRQTLASAPGGSPNSSAAAEARDLDMASKESFAPTLSLSQSPVSEHVATEKFGGEPTSPRVLELVVDAVPADPSTWPAAARVLVPVLLVIVAVRGFRHSHWIKLLRLPTSRRPVEV